ncbi:TetR/AcrR family transcriptional regulator [Salinibacterium sp. ZJ70]|uniref:TetR/AcrR family transcriptional regulator n=1 Tax=Salinibacterium sp. ZJ70 TaxID=2708084 RepID=UPI001CD39FD5|nr:TetR/AcrR family transcriptional regulator [Salinibacterium sp. ZJ70]
MPIDIVQVPKRHHLAPAKQRILDTADRLFYEEGIRTVGIDRLIATSSVTKATFYKHYGSKDRLIVEYVSYRHLQIAEVTHEALLGVDNAEDALRAISKAQAEYILASEFRGCPFLKAATEFPESGHPVRQAVEDHREWLYQIYETLLRQLGHPLPGDAADDLVLARDGAMSGGYAGDPIGASAALLRAYDRTLAGTSTRIAA